MAMKERLVLLNNFLHDLATGTWLGIFLVLWRVRVRLASLGPIGSRVAALAVHPALKDLFWWGVGALAAVLATGAVRLWGERRWGIVGSAFSPAEVIVRGEGRGGLSPATADPAEALTGLWRRERTRLLILKHVLLLMGFAVGTYIEYRLARGF